MFILKDMALEARTHKMIAVSNRLTGQERTLCISSRVSVFLALNLSKVKFIDLKALMFLCNCMPSPCVLSKCTFPMCLASVQHARMQEAMLPLLHYRVPESVWLYLFSESWIHDTLMPVQVLTFFSQANCCFNYLHFKWMAPQYLKGSWITFYQSQEMHLKLNKTTSKILCRKKFFNTFLTSGVIGNQTYPLRCFRSFLNDLHCEGYGGAGCA